MKQLLNGKKAGQALENNELWQKLIRLVRSKGGYVDPVVLKAIGSKEVDFFHPRVFYSNHKNYEFNNRHYTLDELKKTLLRMDDADRNYRSE